jgi:hypothetical protein
VVAGLVVIAAFFRLWRLDAVPPGFQFDEAYNATDALRVLGGERPLFFEANGGREALHIYLIAPFVAALGPVPLALRLPSAFVGIATVVLSYLLWRKLLPDGEQPVPLLAALLLAVSYWHVHFSRYGIRAILLPLLLIPVVYFLWDATQPGTAREWVMARAAKNWSAAAPAPLRSLVLCGAFIGLSLYAHPAARFVPLIVVIWFGWLFLSHFRNAAPLRHFAPLAERPIALGLLRDLVVIGLAAFIVFLPGGLYFLAHPESFLAHPTVVAITDQRVNEGTFVVALAANAARVAGMFFVQGDGAWIHNLSGRPVFDWFIAPFFLIGLVSWARKLRHNEPAAVLLMIWLPVMLLPTLLSDGAPNFSRAIGIMPALFVLPAWGFRAAYFVLCKWFSNLRSTQFSIRSTHCALVFAGAAILLLSVLLTLNDYFSRFPLFPQTYYAYDRDKIDAADHLRAASLENRVFVAPLLAQHATFALLTRAAGFRSFDNGEVVVLPAKDPQRGMLYAFTADADPAYLEEFERTYGGLALRSVFPDSFGKPLLVEYRIAPEVIPSTGEKLPASLPIAPQKPVNANFNGEMRLVGYRIATPPAAGQPFQLTLIWQALAHIAHDYTLFIHLDDASGNRISQRDRRPGNGSYPTSDWSSGDIVVETYDVDPKDASGPLRFAVGWYVVNTGERAHVIDAAGKALADQVVFPAEGTQ